MVVTAQGYDVVSKLSCVYTTDKAEGTTMEVNISLIDKDLWC
jgi:hypothetical protein